MIYYAILAFILLASTPTIGEELVEKLTLRGQGDARYLGLVKVYDAEFFSQPEVEPARIVAAEVSQCLRLTYAVALDREDFILGAETVLDRQYAPGELDQEVRQLVDRLHGAYQPVKKGDRYTLCYDAASTATTLSLNNQPLITITSAQFARTYFGIWLGERAALSDNLREQLLAIRD